MLQQTAYTVRNAQTRTLSQRRLAIASHRLGSTIAIGTTFKLRENIPTFFLVKRNHTNFLTT